MMTLTRYEMLLEAQTPIAHHAEVMGNHAVLMDRKLRMPDGTFQKNHIVTADTMRHGMRAASTYATLEAAGMLDNPGLSESALRLLFSGGMVTAKGDAGNINLEAYRKMVELVPSLAIFGGCVDARVVPGQVQIDDAELICAESLHRYSDSIRGYLDGRRPDGVVAAQVVDPRRAHVEQVTRVRMDPLLDPGKRKLLSAGAEAEVQKRLTSGEVAHEEDDAVAKESSKSSMMPRSFEAICAGSLFRWGLTATTYTELELDTLVASIAAFLHHAQVGGKKGTGHGRLKLVAVWGEVAVGHVADTSVLTTLDGKSVGALFRAHVKAHATEIKSWLGGVNA